MLGKIMQPVFTLRPAIGQPGRRLSYLVGAVVLLLSLLTWNYICEDNLPFRLSSNRKPGVESWRPEDEQQEHYSPNEPLPKIHLLIPGNKANYKICRTVTSALVNDYPTPVLINWGQNAGDKSMNGYDMITGKNWGVLQYLRSLPPSASDDLVIMVDAHDVVFQLPPSIVVRRYNAFRRRTMARLLRQHGAEQVSKLGLDLSVIMGAEKFCWPMSHKHPACYAVPTSPLPPNAYGRWTDQSVEKNRPRWLCSGTIIGPVKNMLKVYEQAHAMWTAYETADYDTKGDQEYFSNMYGRQELSRQYQRGSKEWVFGFGENFAEDKLIFPHIETTHNDYGLGVDLTSGIFQSLNKATDDLSPVVHSNAHDLALKDKKHGTSSIYGERFVFPHDMRDLPMPRGVVDRTWLDVQLFTNFHARSIPAIMHYNGDKSKMDAWWQRLWWTGSGKQLLQKRGLDEGLWIHTDRKEDGKEVQIRWDIMCGAFEDKVFVEPVHDLA